MGNYYFDDEEGAGLARETSHPSFVDAFTADFYYDSTDKFSPFGNEVGANLHRHLEDWYRKKILFRNITKWMYPFIDAGGHEFPSKTYARVLNFFPVEKMDQKHELNLVFIDQSILATCFGQIKITGKLTKDLREVAAIAMKRQQMMYQGFRTHELHLQRIKKMAFDLSQFGTGSTLEKPQ
jgi:uncharacterized protein YfeS